MTSNKTLAGMRTSCPFCEARADQPDNNLHCAADGVAHSWHTCGDIRSEAPGSDCPAGVLYA